MRQTALSILFLPAAENPPVHKIRLGSRKLSRFQGNLKSSIFIKHKLKFRLPAKFQVAFLMPALFAFAPHAGAGTSFLCFAKERKQRKATAGAGLLRKLPSLRTVFRAGSQLAAAPLRACKPLSPEKPRSVRLRQQEDASATISSSMFDGRGLRSSMFLAG